LHQFPFEAETATETETVGRKKNPSAEGVAAVGVVGLYFAVFCVDNAVDC